ncbi:uncharacterized protein LOC134661409 [Cydia amplana]|uniref:uncharacterized protein LOC134661409 n=1 Tax=Cydia amplana TaxID=1869771 RepID=UPI002FE58CDA
MSRVCVRVYIICLCAAVVLSVHVAKEYVCQDPDTGTLHELNTTWRSTTFCGNYTCKIRRINTGQQPSKVFVSLFNQQARANPNNQTNGLSLTKILPELTKDNDRFLNKAEIQKITELLHSVKKSDLQAVIELYNVAQEMYKDIKVADDLDNKASEAVSGESRESSQHKTYWYEPNDEHRKVADMKPEGSEIEGSALYSPSPYPNALRQPYYYSQGRSNYPSYFPGSLFNNDGRVRYPNLPMNQQGVAYYQQRNIYDGPGPTPQSSCNPCVRPYQYQPMPMPANYPPRSTSNTYPYFLTYNYTSQGYNNYYKGNPWAYYDYYRNLPHPKPSHIQRNPNVLEQKQYSTDENSINAEIKNEQSWQTDPLPEDVINEIRANIAQRGKLINIPLKKRIKLERAAKVIKIDQNNRQTRSIPKENSEEKHSRESEISQKTIEESKSHENTEEMETYIEKVTCEPTTELGYFKMGNMNKTFPECCPQKIEDKQKFYLRSNL